MKGGQGNVEILYDSIHDCEYACKHLLDPCDDDAIARFLKEIKIIEKINHPNIIRILDSGVDSKGPYYCMPKYAASLRQYLQDGLFHDFSNQYRILSKIINGVKALHDNGIIHRDLKPDNVLLNNYDDVVICDFGFSKDLTSYSTSLTITGENYGTLGYASPEQCNDFKNVDCRTDIYAIGRIIYDITGLNNGGDTEDIIKRIANKAVSPNKEDRYRNISELCEAVKEAYEFLLDKEKDKDIEVIIANIATGSYSDEVLIEYIQKVIETKNYITGHACDVLTGLSKEQYLYIENNYFDLCMDLHRQIWEDYKDTWGNDYLKVDEMVDTADRLINVSESSRIKGYVLAKLSEFAYSGNRFNAMMFLTDSLSEMSSDTDFKNAFLLYANKAQVSSNYKRIGRNCPSWIR